MLSDPAKAKLVAALQPFYADPDFVNVVGDFTVKVETTLTVPPPNDVEEIDVVKP